CLRDPRRIEARRGDRDVPFGEAAGRLADGARDPGASDAREGAVRLAARTAVALLAALDDAVAADRVRPGAGRAATVAGDVVVVVAGLAVVEDPVAARARARAAVGQRGILEDHRRRGDRSGDD